VVVDPKVELLTLLTVCENGYGKRTDVGEYRLQKRNGVGTINIKATERNGKVVGMKAVTGTDDIVLITQNGIIMRTSAADLRAIGRATQGVRLINLKEGDRLISIERAAREDDEEPAVPGSESVAPADSTAGGAESLPVESASAGDQPALEPDLGPGLDEEAAGGETGEAGEDGEAGEAESPEPSS